MTKFQQHGNDKEEAGNDTGQKSTEMKQTEMRDNFVYLDEKNLARIGVAAKPL